MTDLITLLGFIFAVAVVVVLTIAVLGYMALEDDDDETM